MGHSWRQFDSLSLATNRFVQLAEMGFDLQARGLDVKI
jgi:hypothetical protein